MPQNWQNVAQTEGTMRRVHRLAGKMTQVPLAKGLREELGNQ